MRKVLLYISGKLTEGDISSSLDNIEYAKTIFEKYLELGFSVFCPHLNCSFRTSLSYNDWLEMDLEVLSRCDGIVMLSNWMHSRGAILELKYAIENNISLFFDEDNPSVNDIINKIKGE